MTEKLNLVIKKDVEIGYDKLGVFIKAPYSLVQHIWGSQIGSSDNHKARRVGEGYFVNWDDLQERLNQIEKRLGRVGDLEAARDIIREMLENREKFINAERLPNTIQKDDKTGDEKDDRSEREQGSNPNG